MNIEIAVVLMLRSSASRATGETMARQESSLMVQTTRLRMGRLMKPATRARAATARPEARVSPRGKVLGEELSLPRSFKLRVRSSTSLARVVPLCSLPALPTSWQARDPWHPLGRLSDRSR